MPFASQALQRWAVWTQIYWFLLDDWDTRTCLLQALPGSKPHSKLLSPGTAHVQLPDPEANTLLTLRGSGLGSWHLPGLSHHSGV